MAQLARTSPRCLIFDLFGVLVSFDDSLVYQRLASYCADPHTASKSMHDLVSTPDLICGGTSFQALYSSLVSKYGMNLPAQAFFEIWRTSYSEPMPGMRDLLQQLRGQCRLVLLSNVDPFYWPTVRASIPELQHFDALALSFELGFAKPESHAFSQAVALSGTHAAECLFIDDKRENIQAAAKVGLPGWLFSSCANLKLLLQSSGLELR